VPARARTSTTTTLAPAWLAAALLAGALCVGCGAAAPKTASAPGSGGEAMAQPERGSEQVGTTRSPTDEGGTGEPPAPPPAQPSPGYGEPKGTAAATATPLGDGGDAMRLIDDEEHLLLASLDDAKKGTGLSSGGSDSPCGRACTALGSMRRSVERLCTLSASSDKRCDDSKARLAKDEALVKQARCECAAR
jgi:hypothetical protein